MALSIAIEIKAEIEAMGLSCHIAGYSDDWCSVFLDVPGQQRRFDSMHEYHEWRDEWMDGNTGRA